MNCLKPFFGFLLLGFALSGCGVQSLPESLNDVEAKWAEVLNQYKRRSDLIPNLVKTVKGYASHERETLQAVIEARAKATQLNVRAEDLTPEKLKTFQQNQGQLSQALGRLMVVAERYPDLKASQNFIALQTELAGTENRITIARRRYIESVQGLNNLVTVFPTNLTNSLLYHYDKKPQFEVEKSEQAAPNIDF